MFSPKANSRKAYIRVATSTSSPLRANLSVRKTTELPSMAPMELAALSRPVPEAPSP